MIKYLIVCALYVAIFQMAHSSEIKVVISPSVPGVKYPDDGDSVRFTRNGILVNDEAPIQNGKEIFLKNGFKGFLSPIDAVTATNWLFKSGRFDDIKTYFMSSLSESDVQTLLSDTALNESQAVIAKATSIVGVAAIDDVNGDGVWFFYKLNGPQLKVLYVDYLKKIGGLFFPAYSSLVKDSEIHNLFRAMVFETIDNKKVVELTE